MTKVFECHGWQSLNPTHLPMPADNSHVRALDSAPPLSTTEHQLLESKGPSYRQLMGELIWPMITYHPDIAFPVIKLSQFSNAPAELHYTASKCIFRYLAGTIDQGITYWRPHPLQSLPRHPAPPHLSSSLTPVSSNPNCLFGYADSDWAMDTCHCRSISGIIYMLAGGAIAWKCQVQPTVSLSSTEAELLCATDVGHMALCLQSILDELGIHQSATTLLYEDNRGALLVTNAGQPTCHTRHLDIYIREFAIQQWVERDLIQLNAISTHDNAADLVTKQTSPSSFLEHWDTAAGHVPPSWASYTA